MFEAAKALIAESDVIDLHIDSFIWSRIFKYDLAKRHSHTLLGGRFLGQADLPRLREAGVGGGIWSITTNPFRTPAARQATFLKNLSRIKARFSEPALQVGHARSYSDYQKIRANGKHAAFIGVQGGNAIGHAFEELNPLASDLIKITLIHLTHSELGTTSRPSRKNPTEPVSAEGRHFISWMNRHRILLDLAHISSDGFFAALEAHDKTQPFIVSHTGVSGVHPHWRNLDDSQIRAVAESGGTIGIMYESSFLEELPRRFARSSIGKVVDHMEHVIRVVGDDFVSLGSDWDGLIVPPHGFETCLELPHLIAAMMERKWSEERIRKIMGGNFLRVLKQIRP